MAVPGKVLSVHVIPSGLVAARVDAMLLTPPLPDQPETAHQIPNSGAHTADDQALDDIAAVANAGAASRLGMARTFVDAAVT